MTKITIQFNDRQRKNRVQRKKDPDKGGVFEKGISERKSIGRLFK